MYGVFGKWFGHFREVIEDNDFGNGSVIFVRLLKTTIWEMVGHFREVIEDNDLGNCSVIFVRLLKTTMRVTAII